MKLVFVSYASADRDRVMPFVASLRNAGFQVWMDTSALAPGDDWMDRIGHALAGCEAMVLFLSPKAVRSRVVSNELRAACELGKPVVPVRLEATTLEGVFLLALSGVHQVLPDGEAPQRLIAALLPGEPPRHRDRPPLVAISRTPDGGTGKLFLYPGARLGLGRASSDTDARVNLVTRLFDDGAGERGSERQRSTLISKFHAEIVCSTCSYTVTNFGKHGLSLSKGLENVLRSSLLPTAESTSEPGGMPSPVLTPGESIVASAVVEFTLGRNLLTFRLTPIMDCAQDISALFLERLGNGPLHAYLLVRRAVELALVSGYLRPVNSSHEDVSVGEREAFMNVSNDDGALTASMAGCPALKLYESSAGDALRPFGVLFRPAATADFESLE